jgi:hypothetical protein
VASNGVPPLVVESSQSCCGEMQISLMRTRAPGVGAGSVRMVKLVEAASVAPAALLAPRPHPSPAP